MAVLFTGGKDSTYATHEALKSGLEVKYLITMISKDPNSWMFHTVNINITPFQAEAIGIEQVMGYTSGERDEEIGDLKETIATVRNDVDGIVSGALASTYQKSRIDRVCDELGLVPIAPLWGREPFSLLHEMIDAGFEIMITSVAAEGFDEEWLGRKIDRICLEDLMKLHEKFGINVSGEGGDYETLVVDAPFFKSRVAVLEARKDWDKTARKGTLRISKAALAPK